MEEVMGVGLMILLVVVFLFVYFLPTYIAYNKDHPQRGWILVFNLFGGATFVVWLVCLILAATYKPEDPQLRRDSG